MAINNLNINIVQHFAKSRTIFLFNTKQHFSFKVQFLHILNILHILKHSFYILNQSKSKSADLQSPPVLLELRIQTWHHSSRL